MATMPSRPRRSSVSSRRSRLHRRAGSGVRLKVGRPTSAPAGGWSGHSTPGLAAVAAARLPVGDLERAIGQDASNCPAQRTWLTQVEEEVIHAGPRVLRWLRIGRMAGTHEALASG